MPKINRILTLVAYNIFIVEMLGKANRYVVRVGIFLIAAALLAGTVSCGSRAQNLEIRTWYDLNAVRDNLKDNYILVNDLDSTTAGYEELASPTANGGEGWEPIGFFYEAPFIGSLDGGEYEIRDLFINRWHESVGLFGCVHEAAVIKDIGVVNFTVAGMVWVGALVGENDGFVVNCYCTMGNVTGNWDVGGLVGENHDGTVSNSYYSYDGVLINDRNVITIGALFSEDFAQWLANDKFLDVNEKLSQENGCHVVNDVTDFKELLAFGQDDTLRFRLISDLDLAGEPNFYIPYLAGEFDGNGHRISNLSFNFSFVSQVGLFGQLASDGTVHDMAAENMNITAHGRVGGLVGWNEGDVSDSYSTGRVTGDEYVGGLVGVNDGAVSNSCSTGSVTGEDSIGGLVGSNGDYGAVRNSYSTGNVTGKIAVGGLVGFNRRGTVSNSYSSGSVAGGYVVGGLAGGNGGDVRDCYSTGSVTGEDFIGGLMGTSGKGSTVSNCYSTGSVTCAGHDCLEVGGLVGGTGDYGPVSNCFWGIESSGQDISDGGTGKTTAEMQDIATFSGAAWKITAVANPDIRNSFYTWNIVDARTYPFLSWQPIYKIRAVLFSNEIASGLAPLAMTEEDIHSGRRNYAAQ